MHVRHMISRSVFATAAFALCGFVLAPATARAQQSMTFSAVGGLSLPAGDLGKSGSTGFNLGFRGETARGASGWAWRGDVTYDQFAGKGSIDQLSYLAFALNLVHRGASSSSFYQSGGLGVYNSKVDRATGADVNDTNLGAQLGLGMNFTSDGRVFGEAGMSSAFTTGRSSFWFPIRVGLRF